MYPEGTESDIAWRDFTFLRVKLSREDFWSRQYYNERELVFQHFLEFLQWSLLAQRWAVVIITIPTDNNKHLMPHHCVVLYRCHLLYIGASQ